MGFGFVGFRTVAAAASAKDARQGYVLDGHSLDVRFAQRHADKEALEKPSARAQETSTKLLVKNVPFEATRADLRQLFRCVEHDFSPLLPLAVPSADSPSLEPSSPLPLRRRPAVPTARSSRCGCRARWTTRRAASPSSSLQRGETPRPPSMLWSTHTSSVGISCYSGQAPTTGTRARARASGRRQPRWWERRLDELPRPNLQCDGARPRSMLSSCSAPVRPCSASCLQRRSRGKDSFEKAKEWSSISAA